MKRFPSIPVLLLALAFTSCDESTGTSPGGGDPLDLKSFDSTGNKGTSTPPDPTSLIGTWKQPTGEYAFRSFVFRADGSGNAVSEAGTRRSVSALTWRIQGDSLAVTKDSTTGVVAFAIVGDSLIFTAPGWVGPTRTAFVRSPDANLTPREGDRPTALVGAWTRDLPWLSQHYEDAELVGVDTTWVPSRMEIHQDGVADLIGFEMKSDCGDAVTCAGTMVPSDTLRYRWWTSGSDLYLQLRNHILSGREEVSQDLGDAGPVQVVGWKATSQTLVLKGYFPPYLVEEYQRAP
ncbi:MAG: hypothetical protein H6686_11035 [Fibrobacteria bacterium]|nr:hypothetical protein [Fibrobacteria bacterium]